jgi:alpha-1,3-rhamnosyl/mannosyltransferase
VAFNGVPLLSPLTGIGQYSKSLLQGLDARADVRSLKFYGKGWSEEIRKPSLSAVASMSWKDVIRKMVPNAYEISRWGQQWRFSSGVQKFKPDIYHEPNFLAYRFDGPSVITVHDLSWIRYPETHPVTRVRAMDKFFEPGLRRASRVITVSEFVKQELIEVFGIRPEIIHPVLLGADGLFQPQDAAQTQPVLQGLSLTHGRYLLAVGTLEPRKNLQATLEAYAGLPTKLRERFPLVVVGMKGWKTSSLEQKLAPMVASGQVRQLGYLSREDLATVMAGAAAMVYPSIYEGFGLPPLEAMACRVPVIASNVSSIPEVVGDSGLLIDPLDVQALTQKMAQLLEDEVFRAQLADRALARSQLFSWAKCTDKTVDVYQAAVA